MPYSSYKDLYKKAQNNNEVPYKVFMFDVENSKEMSDETRYDQQVSMMKTMNLMTNMLLDLEKQTGKPVLLSDNNITIKTDIFKENVSTKKVRAYYLNPCILMGDSYCFYVNNNSIKDEDFLNIFYKSCLKTNNYYKYHFDSANFETTSYIEGNKKYYIGYCVGELIRNKKNTMKTVCVSDHVNIK